MELSWDDVRHILAAIDATPLEELDLEIGDLRLVVRKAAPVASPGTPPGRAKEAADFELKAPSVGVFRRAALRGATAFVAPGTSVQAGEVLALIEVVRETHPVRAPLAAEVVAVLVADGEFVEYGQLLMILRPLAPAQP